MTGLDLLERCGLKTPHEVHVAGDQDLYLWWQDVILLSEETAYGANPSAHVAALHELAHWQQAREWPWLFWLLWIRPVRWWLEMDAWRRAVRMLELTC